jgi:hypothetical protein
MRRGGPEGALLLSRIERGQVGARPGGDRSGLKEDPEHAGQGKVIEGGDLSERGPVFEETGGNFPLAIASQPRSLQRHGLQAVHGPADFAGAGQAIGNHRLKHDGAETGR